MKPISLNGARGILAVVWFLGFLPPLLILAARTYVGTYYAGKETEAWAWFTPNIVPTLGLIVGTLVGVASGGKKDNQAPLLLFALTLSLSLIYLIVFNLIFLLEPLVNSAPLEIFKRSSMFLGVIQGVLTGMIGVFFFKQND